MEHLGTVKGEGLLKFGDETIGVGYRIDVWSNGRIKQARGTLAGDEMGLFRAFDARGATLVTEDGDRIEVTITRQQGDDAEIAVNGPVPGF